MARHRASNKHKSSKRKKHTNPSSSGSRKSRSKKVSFEGISSDAVISRHSAKSKTSSKLQDLKHSSSKKHSSTIQTSKRRQRPIPSVKGSGSSRTIQSPVRQKEVHPYAARFSGLHETGCALIIFVANANSV